MILPMDDFSGKMENFPSRKPKVMIFGYEIENYAFCALTNARYNGTIHVKRDAKGTKNGDWCPGEDSNLHFVSKTGT